MADLASILTNPNYVNANEATKRAIFDKFSVQDSNFTNANTATQEAIRAKFGVPSVAAPPPPGVPQLSQATGEVPVGRQPFSVRGFVANTVPLVRPTVEALGAALGGVAGTALGPVGTLGGAGLGYGAAKGVLDVAENLAGTRELPKTIGEAMIGGAQDVGMGAATEGVGRVIGPVVGAAVGKIADLRKLPQNKAADIARQALGPDLPEVLNVLRAAQGQGVSAAQATANINSPTWQALIQRATARDPRFLGALEQSQGEVSLNALARLAGGSTATEARGTAEAMKRGLNTRTEPMKQAALKGADIGRYVGQYSRDAGRLEAEAAEKVADVRFLKGAEQTALQAGIPKGPINVEDIGRYTYPLELAKKADEWATQAANASLDVGLAAREAKAASDALKNAGFSPLQTDTLIARVGGIAKDPAFASNDVMQTAVRNLQKDLAAWTDVNGVIPAAALDAIRKNSVNATVRDLLKGDPVAQKKAAAELLTTLRPMLVDAIEAAGGKGYREYLAEYSKGMQKIAEKKLTGEALNLWKTNKDAFVRLVQGESPEVVEKFLGPGNYNIATELSENTMSVLREQAQKHLTNLKIDKQASAGQDALRQLMMDNLSKIRLPSYLSAVASTTNKALDILENKIGRKTMTTLTESLQTPGGAVSLLERLPAQERNRILKLLSNPSEWKEGTRAAVRGAAAGSLNALAPERTGNNAMTGDSARIVEMQD